MASAATAVVATAAAGSAATVAAELEGAACVSAATVAERAELQATSLPLADVSACCRVRCAVWDADSLWLHVASAAAACWRRLCTMTVPVGAPLPAGCCCAAAPAGRERKQGHVQSVNEGSPGGMRGSAEAGLVANSHTNFGHMTATATADAPRRRRRSPVIEMQLATSRATMQAQVGRVEGAIGVQRWAVQALGWLHSAS